MSVEVVKQVVEMVFQGQQFEQGVGSALQSLEKLKTALNFDGAVKGIENLGSSVKNAGMDQLYNGVYKVQEGFSALDIVATRVIQNMTDKVQNFATNLAEKMTLEPIKMGLEEYETQINSVQTILANTSDKLKEDGLTSEHDRIEKVNSVLDELNHYADMTIYNFTEMTRNIGTFTAAGVELDKSANAIKGIANLAAMSGSNSEQASRAMYQLSQALSTGTLKLQDWNSVVNAGMGGKLFQNELIDTAKTMGIVAEVTQEVDKLDKEGNVVLDENGQAVKKKVKETINDIDTLIEHEGSFRESLASGWITDEILLTTLEKFTAGSEGYTASQIEQMKKMWKARGYSEKQIQELVGNVHQLTEEEEANLRTKWAEKGFSEEQINHILEMGTAATDAATKVKTFTQLLDTIGEALQSGWTQSWEYIVGDFEQAKRLWTEISDIAGTYIGKSADARNEMLKQWSQAAYFYNEEGELVKAVYNEAGELDKEASTEIVEDGKMIRDEMGGRELVIQSLRNAFQACFEIAIEFGEVWSKGFWGKGSEKFDDMSITAEKLIALSRALYDASVNFKKAWSNRDEEGKAQGALAELSEVFRKFAESMRYGYAGIRDTVIGLSKVFEAFTKSSFVSLKSVSTIMDYFGKITDRIYNFGEAVKGEFTDDKTKPITKFFNGLYKVLSSIAFIKIDTAVYAFDALGKVFNKLIEPFGTIPDLLGKVGDYLLRFSKVFNGMFKDKDGSKIESFFTNLATSLGKFIDHIRNFTDFSGFTKILENLLEIMSSKKIEPFKILENVFMGLVNIGKSLIGVLSPIAAAFAKVFSSSMFEGAQFIRDLSDRFLKLTEAMRLQGPVIKGLENFFVGIFSIIKSIVEVLGKTFLSIWDMFAEKIGKLLPTAKDANTALTDAGEELKKFADKISSLNGGDGVSKLVEFIKNLADAIKNFFGAFKEINVLETFVGLIKKIGDGIKKALGGTDDMSLLDTVVQKLKDFFQAIKDLVSNQEGDIDPAKVLIGGGLGVLIAKIVEFVKDFGGKTTMFKKIADTLNDFADTVGEAIENIGNHFKTQSIQVIATSLLEIAGALFILSIIDAGALAKSLAALTAIFQQMERLIVVISSTDKKNVAAGAAVIAALGLAILQISAAVTILSMLKPEKLAQGLIGVSIVLWELVAAGYAFSKMDSDLAKGAGSLILLAIALNLLVIPIVALGHLDINAYNQGVGAVTALLIELVAAAILLGKFGKDFKPSNAIGLILMAESVKILADACLKVKDIPWPDLGKGLAVMAVGLLAMVGAAAIIAKAKLGDDILLLGESLVLLGVAMELLVNSAMGLHGVEWEDLGKMAAVLGVSLLMLWAASKRIDGKNLLMIGGAIFLVATAITELSLSLNLAKVIAPICTALGSAIGGIADAAHSFAMDKSMEFFINFLKNLITFLPQLAVALAVSIGEMIAALAGVAGKIGASLVEIGKVIFSTITQLIPEAFNMLGTFFTELWGFLNEQIPGLFSVLSTFFAQLWGFLTEQVPNFFTWLGTVFEQFFLFLQEKGPMLIEFLRIMIDTVLQAIITEAPVIGETILVLLQTLLTIIQTAIPEITFTLLSLIMELLNQLVTFVPQMSEAAMQIIMGFLQAVANNIGQITQAACDIAIAFMDGLAEKMPELVDSAFNLLISWIDGLATAIDENHDRLWDAVGHLIKSIVDAIIDGITKVVKAGEDLVHQFTDGLTPQDVIDSIFNAGANLVQGFIDGIGSLATNVWNAACDLGNQVISAITGTLDENSPSKVAHGIGEYFTIGFANGIVSSTSDAVGASKDMATGVLGAFSDIIGSDDTNFTPAISPVVDTSNIGGFNKYIGEVDNTINGTATITGTIDANNELKTKMAEMMAAGSDYTTILSGMNSLREDLASYNDNISKLQIVMDTGTVVGELTPGMDKGLGRAATLARRGV